MKHKNFDSVFPYAYYIKRISDGIKYVGVRYANVKLNLTPNEDFARTYFTSGKLKKDFKKNISNYEYRVLYTFDSIEEMFAWEKKITLRIYKKKDWANNGWCHNYGDNPIIGELISEGKNKIKISGKTSIEEGSDSLKDWIWNTKEGAAWREQVSKRKKLYWDSLSEEQRKEIADKRVSNMDFKTARAKASITFSQVGEDGLTGNQRMARKAAETRRKNNTDSIIGKKRNEAFNKKLGEMSEEEFKNFCEGKATCFVKGAITRRNKYLNSLRNNDSQLT